MCVYRRSAMISRQRTIAFRINFCLRSDLCLQTRGHRIECMRMTNATHAVINNNKLKYFISFSILIKMHSFVLHSDLIHILDVLNAIKVLFDREKYKITEIRQLQSPSF